LAGESVGVASPPQMVRSSRLESATVCRPHPGLVYVRFSIASGTARSYNSGVEIERDGLEAKRLLREMRPVT
jgi:hypothetical protein